MPDTIEDELAERREALDKHEWGDPALRQEWMERSRVIGSAASEHLERLLNENESITAVGVSTRDGFNLCTVGIPEEAVTRFAALGSSLHSVAGASVTTAIGDEDVTLDAVSVRAGEVYVLYHSFAHPTLGALVLTAASRRMALGEMLIETKRTAAALQDALKDI